MIGVTLNKPSQPPTKRGLIVNYTDLVTLIRTEGVVFTIRITGAVTNRKGQQLPADLVLAPDDACSLILSLCKYYEEEGTKAEDLLFNIVQTNIGYALAVPSPVLH